MAFYDKITAVEMLGAWGPSALELCRDIGSRIAKARATLAPPSFCAKGSALRSRRGTQRRSWERFRRNPPPHLEHGARLCDDEL